MSNDEALRLAARYAGMSDGELERVAEASADLTDEARAALTTELEKRRLAFAIAPPTPPPSYAPWPEVKRFDKLADAEQAKEVLDAAGIESYLERETSKYLVDRIISNLLGTVKLLVKTEDLDDAREVLNPHVEYEKNLQHWTMVRRFRDLPEATLAKGALESAGIECHLADDNMVRLDWFISNLIGGAKLVVKPEDLDAAQQVLDQPTPAEIEYDEGQDFDQPSCPNCGSFEVTFENTSKGVALAGLYVLAIPLPIASRRWICGSCGAKWTDDERKEGSTPSLPSS